jgi:hypothetical protein
MLSYAGARLARNPQAARMRAAADVMNNMRFMLVSPLGSITAIFQKDAPA